MKNIYKVFRISYVILSAAFLMMPCHAATAQQQQQGKSEKMVIEFNEKIHDFGDILLSDGAVSCIFTFKNVSKEPIVIHNVVSSCGCTTPSWTRHPVKPSENGEIKVVFDNDQGPYPFEKTLTVYVSGVNRPVTLRIRGVSHEKKKNLAELYSVHFGKLGFRKKNLPMGYIDNGTVRNETIDIANLSKEAIAVAAASTSKGLVISVAPNPIPPKSTAKMTFTVDTRKMPENSWGRQELVAGFSVNGKKVNGTYTVNANIKDNFSSLTPEQTRNAAAPVIEKSYWEFGEVKRGTAVEATYTIRNKGKSNLVIHKVESESNDVTYTTACPVTVKPGGEVPFTVKMNTSSLDGEVLVVFTAITNSPAKPMFNLFLTGNVKR